MLAYEPLKARESTHSNTPGKVSSEASIDGNLVGERCTTSLDRRSSFRLKLVNDEKHKSFGRHSSKSQLFGTTYESENLSTGSIELDALHTTTSASHRWSKEIARLKPRMKVQELFGSTRRRAPLAWQMRPFVNYHFDRDGWCKESIVFSPDAKVVHLWNIIVLFCLLWTLFILPMELAGADSTKATCLFEGCYLMKTWKAFDSATSIIFIVDVLVHFNIAVEDENGKRDWSRSQISCNYVSGWFFLDLFCSIPFDLLDWDLLKTLRALKLVRLIRTFKIWNIHRMYQVECKFWQLMLIRCFFVTFMAAHWISCFWAGLATKQGGKSWLDALVHDKVGLHDEEMHDLHIEESPWRLYLWSMYFSITLVTTVGFGDVTPQNETECFVTILSILLGTVVWGFILSSVHETIRNVDQHHSNMEKQSDELKIIMSQHSISDDTQHNVLGYIRNHQNGSYQSLVRRKDFMNSLSKSLRGKIRHEMWNSHVENLMIVRAAQHFNLYSTTGQRQMNVDGFTNDLCMLLDAKIVDKLERFQNRRFSIMQSGVAVIAVGKAPSFRVMVSGGVMGEEFLLERLRKGRGKQALALTPVSMLQINRKEMQSLNKMLASYPGLDQLFATERRWQRTRQWVLNWLETALDVNDAGDNCNGLYVAVRDHGGRPKFQNANDAIIFWDKSSGRWNLNSEDNTNDYKYRSDPTEAGLRRGSMMPPSRFRDDRVQPPVLVRVSARRKRSKKSAVFEHIVGGLVRPEVVADESSETEDEGSLEALVKSQRKDLRTQAETSARLEHQLRSQKTLILELTAKLVGQERRQEQRFDTISRQLEAIGNHLQLPKLETGSL